MYGDYITDEQMPIEIDFDRGDYLGGRLAYHKTTDPGRTYFVDRDISIISDGHLTVSAGTTLEFQNALGKSCHIYYVHWSPSYKTPLFIVS